VLTRGIYQLQKTLGLGEKYYREEETDKQIVITLAVPGAQSTEVFKILMSKEHLKVVFEGNHFCDPFIYINPLPSNINKIESLATLEDGLLTVLITKN
jgi:HSP20 family molecular chaperone IbpA